MLEARGFTGHLHALNGSYTQAGDNHGKPTYSKPAEIEGAQKCCVYFWDERDGDALAGWWMAPTVGGEQVWAHCPSRAPQPPTSGWKVPWHASSPDPAIRVEFKAGGQKRPLDTQGANPLQRMKTGWSNPSAQGGNSWGQSQPAGGWTQGNQWSGKGNQPKGGGKESGGKGGKEWSQGNQWDRGQKGQAGNKGGPMRQNQNEAQQKQIEAQNKQKRENVMKQIMSSVEQVEKVMKQITDHEKEGEGKFDKQKSVNSGRAAIASARRLIDVNVKGSMIDEASLAKPKGDIVVYEKQIDALAEEIKREQMQKLKDIETSLSGTETQKSLTDLEAAVEKTKDAAVLFTCEMAEHIKAEDALESHEKTEKEAKIATDIIKKIKETLFTKERELRAFPAAETDKIRKVVAELQGKVTAFEREVRNVQGQSTQAVKKARQEVEKKKQVEAREARKKEQEAIAQWNHNILGFVYQVNLISDDMAKQPTNSRNLQQLAQAESRMMGLKAELIKRSEMKEANPTSKKELGAQVRKIDGGLNKIQKARKEVQNRDHDQLDSLAIKIAVATRKMKGDKEDEAFFHEHTNKGAKMTNFHFEKLVRKTGVTGNIIMLFNEVCQIAGAGTDTLTCEEFHLHVAHNYFEVQKPSHLTSEKTVSSDKVDGGQLERGIVVDLLEGPEEVEDTVIRAKCKVVNAAGDGKEGWVTLRAHANESLKRFSPLYTVLTETVLTDTFSLKGFKVVRRIKKDEKFRALTIPTFNEEAEMLRVQGVTEENESAWITVRGNRGTPLLKNDPIQKEDDKDVEPEDFSEDLLHTLLQNMAGVEREQAEQHKKEASEHLSTVSKAVEELVDMDSEGKEPVKEEVDALCLKVEEAFRTALKAGSESKQRIQSISKQISNVEAGPYKELRVDLAEILESVSKSLADVTGMREKQREHTISIKQKEKERRDAKELAEAEALAEKIMSEVEVHQDAVVDKHTKLVDVKISEMAKKDPLEIDCDLKELKALVTESEELGEKIKAWCSENQPKQANGCLQKASQSLGHCRNKTMRLLQQITLMKKHVTTLEATMKEKSQVLIGVTLSKYIAAKKQSVDDLFATIAKKLDVCELPVLEKFLAKLGCKSPCLELICKSLGAEITKDVIGNLVQVNYRCVKRCLLTDKMEVSSCKKLRVIEPEEVVTILDAHTTDEETGVVRIRARTANDGLEGWMPIEGNNGAEYFKLRGPWYKVIRDTVFTDDFSMQNVKVIRRLKVGDKLRCLQYPKHEEKSGLLRMQAVSLDDTKTTGWVTIKGNQGSMFVVDCDLQTEEKQEDAEMKEEETVQAA